MDAAWSEVVGMVLCLVVSAYFAFCDAALKAFGVARAQKLFKQGRKRMAPLAEEPNRVFFALAFGQYGGLIVLSALLGALGDRHGYSFWLAVACTAAVGLTITEVIAPGAGRSQARSHVEPILLSLRPWLAVLKPVTTIFGHLAQRLGHQEVVGDLDAARVFEEDLVALVDAGAKQGSLTEFKGRILHSAFEFGDTAVREVMVPRTDVVACSVTASLDEVIALVVGEGHSRIPVYQDSVDNIVGVLYAKDLFRYLNEPDRGEFDVMAWRREPFFVPETKRLNVLFKDFQREHVHMAVVVDEFGVIAGIVTLEDIIEEFFGEIQDEYDSEEEPFQVVDETHVVAGGRISIYEIGSFFDIEFPDDLDYDTLGGLVVAEIGKVPDAGTVANAHGLRFTVLDATEKRVLRVDVTRQDDPAHVESEGPPQPS